MDIKERFSRILLAAALLVTLVPGVALNAHARDNEATKPYMQEILSACLHQREQAEAEIDDLLSRMEDIDPEQADAWEQILDNWSWAYQEMEVNADVLPDGLPQDDSLCIVVMGLCLSENGSVKPELVERLMVAVRSAEKYPNAYILCTGGASSDVKGLTEARQMELFLLENGIDKSRIILEDEAMSTTENAQNSYGILCGEYPQIQHVAVVTSDYHVRRSCMMFNAVSLYSSAYDGGRSIDVVGNAVCHAESERDEGLYTQAWGLAIMAGVELEEPQPDSPGETSYPVG